VFLVVFFVFNGFLDFFLLDFHFTGRAGSSGLGLGVRFDFGSENNTSESNGNEGSNDNRGEGNVCDMSRTTAPVALNTVALAIDRHGLRWNEERRERFRLILGRIPVPRRFEYRDLFRPQIAV